MVNIIRRSSLSPFGNGLIEQLTSDGTWSLDEDGLPYLTNPITGVNLTNIAYQTQYDMYATPDRYLNVSSPDLPCDVKLRAQSLVNDAFTDLPKNIRASGEIQLNGRPGWTQLNNFAFIYEDTSIVYPPEYTEQLEVVGIICLAEYQDFLFNAGLTWKGNLDGTEPLPYKVVPSECPYITQTSINEHECVYKSCIQLRKLDYCITYVENAMQIQRRRMEKLWSMPDE